MWGVKLGDFLFLILETKKYPRLGERVTKIALPGSGRAAYPSCKPVPSFDFALIVVDFD
jgi:hypothetical protein